MKHPPPMMHVVAVGSARLPHHDADGRLVPGRHTGRDAKHELRAEHVPATAYYERAVLHGDLVIVPEPPEES